jgi:hypothetical protein
MATYEQVSNAGDLAGQNVYKAVFATEDCSDMPQLQSWDDEDMDTVASESLQGTTNNGGDSQMAAVHVTNVDPGVNWATGLAGVDGGGVIQGGGFRANRLRGEEQYLLLGDGADVPPIANGERMFNIGFAVHDDSTPGTSGHRPVLAIKTFYAGAAPDVGFWYNRGTEGVPDWVQMTHADKGTPMAIGLLNTIHATGPNTTTLALDPVTKPGSGEKWAEEQWIQTAL